MRTFAWRRLEYVFRLSFLLALLISFPPVGEGQALPQRKYWVYFRDKGPGTFELHSLKKGSHVYESAKAVVTDRALWRRGKVLREESLIDITDLPVYESYVDELVKRGIRPHVSSRWLNAVSGYLTPEQVSTIASLPFVKQVIPVVTFFRGDEPIENKVKESRGLSIQKADGLNYGASLEQVSLINVPAVHDLGINGTSVLIGMLDSGFRWKTHEALNSMRVIAEYDFIFHDSVTANQANDALDQDSHGTSTLSTIGGFKPGQLIGPAYGASFMLAKTEYIPTETEIEEDNWVAGIEWMETRGVDVVSSSLGYTTFDDGTGYRYSQGDFNGRTAVTTKAAVIAARKGVVVANSMGNGGNTAGSIIAPADADSIISVGAVNFSGVLASFSSVGPTNDGRTKPDVVAPGVSIYVASPSGSNVYGRGSGTSFSCPLTAGVAALVLSAHPEFTPIQVRDALRSTASRSSPPNNSYGWGLINAYTAVLSSGLVFSNQPLLYFNDSKNIIVTYAASNAGVDNLSMRLYYSLDGGRNFSPLQMVPTTAANQFLATIPAQTPGNSVHYYIEGADQAGARRTSPYDAPANLFSFRYGEGDTTRLTSSPIPIQIPSGFVLYQNYPNPFNPSTRIQFYSLEFTDGEIIIYNTLGEKVKTVLSGKIHPGNNFTHWDGRDERGRNVASGVYFYQFRSPTFSETKRMLLIR